MNNSYPFTWDSFWARLYAVSIGHGATPSGELHPNAGIRPHDLRYLNEGDAAGFLVSPTFPTAAMFRCLPHPPWTKESPLLKFIDYDPHRLLHGEQSIELHVPALPATFKGSLVERIGRVMPKSSGVVVEIIMEVHDEQPRPTAPSSKQPLATMKVSVFLVGGEVREPTPPEFAALIAKDSTSAPKTQGPKRVAKPQDKSSKEPLVEAGRFTTSPAQAALYRLNGDSNAIHIDPSVAVGVGLPAPILHGLCTYGIVGRLLQDSPHVRSAFGSGAAGGGGPRLTGLSMRFATPVLPGETIVVRIDSVRTGRHNGGTHDDASVLVAFHVVIEHDSRKVCTHGVATLVPGRDPVVTKVAAKL